MTEGIVSGRRSAFARLVRAQDGIATIECIAFAAFVGLVGMTAAWLVTVRTNPSAHMIANNLIACESYAAQHDGATKGC